MTLSAQNRDRYVAAFEKVRGNGMRNPLWLRRLRDEALARFLSAGFPSQKDEDWKYTSLALLEQGEFDLAAREDAGAPVEEIEELLPSGAAGRVLVFLDGRYRPELSAPPPMPGGAYLCSIADALSGGIDGLVPYFTRSPGSVFTDLNIMLSEDGVFLHLGKNVHVEKPVHFLFLGSTCDRPVMSHPRNLIIAGENSRLTVVEQYACRGRSGHFVNSSTDVVAGPNASVTHYKIQEDGPDAIHVATLRTRQEAGSRLTAHSASFGARLSRNDIQAVLDGEGAECLLNGLYLGNGNQHVDHFTTIDHARPSGASREYFHGILDDKARGVFRGRVIVRRDAQKTDARQTNRNLLLSEDSEADSRPQLEIHADDVKCTHGATVGPLDEEKVFYMRSRGIDKASAEGLLTYAFAADILKRFEHTGLRSSLEKKVLAWLPDARRLREILRETGN